MNRKQLKSAAKAEAKAFLLGSEQRLERWIWDERSLSSIIDRATMPVVMGVLDKLQAHGTTLESIGIKGISMSSFIKLVQTVIGKLAHTYDRATYPTREGKLVFTRADLEDIPPVFFTPEVSRHDDHVLVPEQLEAAEYSSAIEYAYDERMVELCKAHDKASGNVLKPVLSSRALTELNRVGSSTWRSPVTLYSQVGRMHHGSKGDGTFQNGKGIRACSVFANPEKCDSRNLEFFQAQLSSAYNIDESLYDTILADPLKYSLANPHGKETRIVIGYCWAIQEILETGSTRRMAGYDMPASLLMYIYLILGLPVDEVERIAFVNSPRFKHARKRLMKRVRNLLTHLQGIDENDLDGDVIKPCFTKGGYGAAAKAIALSMLGLSSDDEMDDPNDVTSILDNFLGVDSTAQPTPPDCIAHLYFDNEGEPFERQNIIDGTIDLCDRIISVMMGMYPALAAYVDVCRKLWKQSVIETGAPPSVVAAHGYVFNGRLWRRDLSRWTKVTMDHGVGQYVVPDEILVNKFIPAESGTPMPPNGVHLTEATGMTLSILDAKRIDLQMATNMDWYAVPVGRSLDLMPVIRHGVNATTAECFLTQLSKRIQRPDATIIPEGAHLARL
jgi:hypothetical protein